MSDAAIIASILVVSMTSFLVGLRLGRHREYWRALEVMEQAFDSMPSGQTPKTKTLLTLHLVLLRLRWQLAMEKRPLSIGEYTKGADGKVRHG